MKVISTLSLTVALALTACGQSSHSSAVKEDKKDSVKAAAFDEKLVGQWESPIEGLNAISVLTFDKNGNGRTAVWVENFAKMELPSKVWWEVASTSKTKTENKLNFLTETFTKVVSDPQGVIDEELFKGGGVSLYEVSGDELKLFSLDPKTEAPKEFPAKEAKVYKKIKK